MAEKIPEDIALMLKNKEDHTPAEGFNLVAVDTFAKLGEQLYTVDHTDTLEAAQESLKLYQQKEPDMTCYIYGPKGQ